MALTDLTRISTSGIATGTSLSGAILHGDAHFRGTQVGVTSGLFASSDDALEFADSAKAVFGTGSDLSIHWDGTDGHITVGGTLNIDGSGETLAKFIDDGAVQLYHDNTQKLTTASTSYRIDLTYIIKNISTYNSANAIYIDTNTKYVWAIYRHDLFLWV